MTSYTREQTIQAIETWLAMGRQMFENSEGRQGGLFAPGGWDYECLSAHLSDLRSEPRSRFGAQDGVDRLGGGHGGDGE